MPSIAKEAITRRYQQKIEKPDLYNEKLQSVRFAALFKIKEETYYPQENTRMYAFNWKSLRKDTESDERSRIWLIQQDVFRDTYDLLFYLKLKKIFATPSTRTICYFI